MTLKWRKRTHVIARLAMATALAIGVLASNVQAAQPRSGRVGQPASTQQGQNLEPQDPRIVELDRLDSDGRRFIYVRPAIRFWQDYVLKSTDAVRDVAVVSGRARIEGYVDGDVVVVLGDVDVANTAVIRGSLFVWAGNATIAEGASIRRDLLVVGGDLVTPPGFAPGGEHIVVGAPWLGDQARAVVPWLTRGLLWGRLIVPSLSWVWWVVAFVMIVTLAINVVLHAPVTRCAETLAEKPFSTFLAGLLVLLLAGPVSVLLAATVVGLAVIPFALCAVVVAWVVGKVGVSRWIGRSVTGQQSPETVPQALRSVVVGFAAICLVYMVPVLGLVAWALIGVFGLGSASLTFVSALRRERPAPAPKPVVPPNMSSDSDSSAGAPAFVTEVPPPVAVPTPAALPPLGHTPPATAVVGDLALMPRAMFLDRVAAAALDVALVLVLDGLINFSRRDNGWLFVLLFAYAVGFWAWKGTTIGGIICNLRVVRIDGAPLRFVDALVRGLASVFSTAALTLGWLWILRDPERQAWHDRIAGTYVVKVPRTWPI